MASRRLNERLAKYNYLYDTDAPDDTNGTTTLSSPDVEDKLSNGDTFSINNNNSSNSDRVTSSLSRKYSDSSSVSVAASIDSSPKSPKSPTTSFSKGASPRGPLLSHITTSASTRSNFTNASPSISSRNISKREAFFKSEAPSTRYEAPSTRFDPSLRERDGKAEKLDRHTAAPKENGHNGHRSVPDRMDSAKSLEGYVGFANLPNQVYRKAVKRGFEFTLMVVGESGLGKSTLINSLFLTDLYSKQYPGPSQRPKKTSKIDSTQVLLKEGGVQLKLTIVDTPGFGDSVDNSECWQPVIDHIDSKFDEYLNAESRVNRKAMPDNRVQCCLYFIAPTGHSLKPLDIEFMKRLHEKVNIIPLIAKADTMTPEECKDFKKNILNEIAKNNIRIYEFPDVDDDEENVSLKKLKDRVPFAVVGSNTVMDVNGKRVRGRQYPWGTVEVDNLEHNDFLALRDMLIRTHMQDLRDVTNNVHYENFRYKKLANVSVTDGKVKDGSKDEEAVLDADPLTQMEEERRDHRQKMKKMEAEMEQVFEMKVKEKMQKLKDSEADLQRRAEQMKKSLEQQEQDLEYKRRAFFEEKTLWESQNKTDSLDKETMKKHKKGLF